MPTTVQTHYPSPGSLLGCVALPTAAAAGVLVWQKFMPHWITVAFIAALIIVNAYDSARALAWFKHEDTSKGLLAYQLALDLIVVTLVIMWVIQDKPASWDELKWGFLGLALWAANIGPLSPRARSESFFPTREKQSSPGEDAFPPPPEGIDDPTPTPPLH